MRGKGERFAQFHIGLQGKQRVLAEADGIVVALIVDILNIQITAHQSRKPRKADPIRKAAKEAFAAEQVFREQGGRRCRRAAGFLRQHGARETEHGQQRQRAQERPKRVQ